MSASELRRDLLAWFAREARDLAWRRTQDPYASGSARPLLQQTRVEVVEPFFARFLSRFPERGGAGARRQ
jgi:A/G-specific adenine glycosylase